jgi:hypothetical protein
MRKSYLKLKKKIKKGKTIVKKSIQMLTGKKCKSVVENLVSTTPAPDYNAVIVTIGKFKSIENHIGIEINQENNFDKFSAYIVENSQGKKLPKIKKIETELGITEDTRKKLYKEGITTGLLVRDEKGKYYFNINYEPEGKEDDI